MTPGHGALLGLLLLGGCHAAPNPASPEGRAQRRATVSDDRAYLPALPSTEHVRLPDDAPGAPVVRDYRGAVRITTGGGPVGYRLDLVDVALGSAYRSEIAYLGAGDAAGAARPAAGGADARIRLDGASGGIAALVRDNPQALVMNGGFSASDPSRPAGLLLVAGRVQSPFNFAHYGNDPAKPLRMDSVVCVTREGHIDFLRAADFEQGDARIADRCRSALQTTPFVLQNGQSRISNQEPDARAPALRSLLGIDARGGIHAIFFRSPVHLAIAAAILRAPDSGTGDAVTVSGGTGAGFTADHGLGLTDVVNLDGDADATGALHGQRIAGDLNRELPSAIVILP